MPNLRPLLAAAVAVWWAAVITFAEAAGSDPLAPGRLLYLDGKRGDGTPLLARRAGGLALSGGEAACVNCHRRSGFGGSEGRSYIPPINAATLFAANLPDPSAASAGNGRPAYTETTLARALREGVDPSGRRLDYLMPRYDLTDAEIQSLLAHLRQPAAPAPGHSAAGELHFATVLAPGVAPQQAQAMTAALQACVDEHNAGPPAVQGRQRLGPDLIMAQPRQWQLHVWELSGAPETWAAQLAEYGRRQPVFAMLGGIGGSNWRPIHDYCEGAGLPCLFPHLEVPAVGETGFYNLYLSRGLLLEAALVARHLAEQSPTVKRVVQVLRRDDASASAAAAALRRSLAARGIASAERHLDAANQAGLFATAATEALVLWLRPEDLTQLPAVDPVAGPLYLSATLAGLEHAPLPRDWKKRALLAYPFELPQNRLLRQKQLRTWLATRGLSPADELVQGDAYLACAALGIGINAVADHLDRDYLVERLEVIIGRGGLAGHYPRLSLGAGQRFSSKAGYLVRFVDPEAVELAAVGERLAP